MFITDGDERAVLAACRALADAGWDVTLGRCRRVSVSGWSRSVTRSVYLPHALERAAFLASLRDELREGRYDVLIPGADASLDAISDGRQALESQARIGLPSRAAVRASLDKTRLVEAGEAVGMPCPPTVVCESGEDAVRAGALLGYPFVVKPASALERKPSGGRRSAILVESPEAAATSELDHPFLAQRYERESSVVWVSGVYAAGELRAVGGGRFIRTWPPGLGSASRAHSFLPSERLRDKVMALLEAIGWSGIFQLQLIESGTRYSPIDLNPRVYGSLALDVAAGANLPAVWCNWLIGIPGTFEKTHDRLAFSWEEGEFRNTLSRLTGNHRQPALHTSQPKKLPVIRAHFTRDDPTPALACALNIAAKGAAKATARGRRRRKGSSARS